LRLISHKLRGYVRSFGGVPDEFVFHEAKEKQQKKKKRSKRKLNLKPLKFEITEFHKFARNW
jgi:hypothetical protein